MVELQVLKSSGELESYDEDKLRRSLKFTKATDEQVEKVIKHVRKNLRPNISTRRIYSLAFSQLRKIGRPLSAYYGTKKALLELGQDGYVFEKYIAKLLEYLGHKTINNVDIMGKCVSHEVDVIADIDNTDVDKIKDVKERILIECKFHRTSERRNDLKTVLYVKARSEDIEAGPRGSDFSRFLLVSNTSFSEDAIRYASCAGLYIWGANFPPQNTLQDIIREYRLDPVTCLSSLNKSEKNMLIESGVLLIREILESPQLLDDIGLEPNKSEKVLHEIKKLVKGHHIPEKVGLRI